MSWKLWQEDSAVAFMVSRKGHYAYFITRYHILAKRYHNLATCYHNLATRYHNLATRFHIFPTYIPRLDFFNDSFNNTHVISV